MFKVSSIDPSSFSKLFSLKVLGKGPKSILPQHWSTPGAHTGFWSLSLQQPGPRPWSLWPLRLHKVPRGVEGTGICLSCHVPHCLIWGQRKNDGSFFLLLFLFLSSPSFRKPSLLWSPVPAGTLASPGFPGETEVCLSAISHRAWTILSWYETKATRHASWWPCCPSFCEDSWG